MKRSLFDLHCDTAYEMLRRHQGLADNKLAVSLQNASVFERYVQVMALWTDHNLTDEAGWEAYLAMLQNLKGDPAVCQGDARLVERYPADAIQSPTLMLGVEDARILAGRPERVDRLITDGVRILTPLWKGRTCIGGSHDTSEGLTDFGRAALRRAAAGGIILDISHASVEAADEIFEIAAEQAAPVIASHSNAYAICPVSRNLRDAQIAAILQADGVIGLNLYGAFLRSDGDATLADALRHIDYFCERNAAHALCLGCDMDGCTLPPDLPDLSALPRLAELMLRHGYSEALVEDLFFENADRFARRYFSDSLENN